MKLLCFLSIFLLISIVSATCKSDIEELKFKISSYKAIYGTDPPQELKDELKLAYNCTDDLPSGTIKVSNENQTNSTYLDNQIVSVLSIIPPIILVLLGGITISYVVGLLSR